MTETAVNDAAQTGTAQLEAGGIQVSGLRVEYGNGFGLGVSTPRLSWVTEAASPGWSQQAYQVEWLPAGGGSAASSGRVDSSESVLVPWPFEPLVSRQRGQVRVRVWGGGDSPTAWSEWASLECALLEPADWSARVVLPAVQGRRWFGGPRPLLRREFELAAGVARARLYVTALGLYEASINGAVVGDEVLAPGWTSYHRRLAYQTFDVTDLVRQGRNAVGIMLGDGWYAGRLTWGNRRNLYGSRLGALAQLEVTYEDGSSQTVVTDDQWRSAAGPVLATDLYDGETYDARHERPGWNQAGFDAREWTAVEVTDTKPEILSVSSSPPIRRTEVVSPVSCWTSPSGATLLDFGQNLVGRLRLTVQGPAGAEVVLRHAEVLQDGELCVRPLRSAKATDRYRLRGDGQPETYEPIFTFHGFRYAEITGWPGEFDPASVQAIVCHSDMRRTGWFSCSDPLLERLHENAVWSMRGNFVSVPTDCPQRDERLGWTGDINVFTPTAAFLYDSAGFLASWLRDLALDQTEDGAVPIVVPYVLPTPTASAAVWGDAAVVVPWVLYQRFGDTGVLEAQFESMAKWVDHVAELAGPSHLWNTGFQFGDWLDPAAPPDRPGAAKTDAHLVATAAFAHSADLLAEVAGVLGRQEDQARYAKLAADTRQAFEAEYTTPGGRLVSDSQTACALVIEYGLVPDEERRRRVGDRLVELVRQGGYHVGTGFVGTPLVCDALCRTGHVGTAFALITERTCPSWLYPVTMGATTIWERWDSMLEDGSVNPGEMTSFNHYALGAVADWLHRIVAGLAPGAAGYRRLAVQPHPGGGLTHARARLLSPYGLAESGWRLEGSEIVVEVTVPANTTATVTLPGSDRPAFDVGSGRHEWRYTFAGLS